MSTIRANSFGPLSGTLFTLEGVAKSLLRYEHDSSPTILGSLNVSSVTDNGTGDWTANFTTLMADAGYTCSISGRNNRTHGSNDNASVPTTAALRCGNHNNSGVSTDDPNNYLAVFGDLAA